MAPNNNVISPPSTKVSVEPASENTGEINLLKNTPNHSDTSEFCKFQQCVLNNLAYFGVATLRFLDSPQGPYNYESNTFVGKLMYWTVSLNAVVKAVFLAFLVLGYFGSITFLDLIGAADYCLCFVLISLAAGIWFRKYPFYEIVKGAWTSMNAIYVKLGSPPELRKRVKFMQKSIVVTHCSIMWGGCFCLMMQYFPAPKYCTFTYSSFEYDTSFLRYLFGAHEFFFMKLAWDSYGGSLALCVFQGIALSNILDKMTDTLQLLYERAPSRITKASLFRKDKRVDPREIASGTHYNIDRLIMDYRQLTIICNQFNDHLQLIMLIMHLCAGFQYISDVFAGTHIIKLPGAGFQDVWFYIEDSIAACFILLRTYIYMALVSFSSTNFLKALTEYMSQPNRRQSELRRVAKSLKVISLNIGPCSISKMSVMTVLSTLSNYYVCAALW